MPTRPAILTVLAAGFAALLVAAPVAPACAAEPEAVSLVPVTGTVNYDYAIEVAAIVNAERAAAGRPGLVFDAALTESAMLRAAEIAVSFSHTRPNRTSCYTAFPPGHGAAGENIAIGHSSPAVVMDGWMNSSGHRSNILSASFAAVGVGAFLAGGSWYWVQTFSDSGDVQPPGAGAAERTVPVEIAPADFRLTLEATPSSVVLGGQVAVTATLEQIDADGWSSLRLDPSAVGLSASNPGVLSVAASQIDNGIAVSPVLATAPGTATLSATISPFGPMASVDVTVNPLPRLVVKATSTKPGTVKATWKKVADAGSFEVVFGLSKSLTKAKAVRFVSDRRTALNVKKKAWAGRTVYVKVRTCRTLASTKVCGAWSKIAKVKAKPSAKR